MIDEAMVQKQQQEETFRLSTTRAERRRVAKGAYNCGVYCPKCNAYNFPRIYKNKILPGVYPEGVTPPEKVVICSSCHENISPFIEELEQKMEEAKKEATK